MSVITGSWTRPSGLGFKGFYNDLAGLAWVDWLFTIGLLGIGLASASSARRGIGRATCPADAACRYPVVPRTASV